jgi:hypothetical protein
MNIAILKTVCDPIYGVFTSHRGEGIYAFIWAKFLADLGHNVVVNGLSQPLPEYIYSNVEFKSLEDILDLSFDIIIGFSCSSDILNKANAKKKILALFGYPNLALMEKFDKDIAVANPYKEYFLNGVKKDGRKCGLLPAIFSDKILNSNFSNKGIFCAVKEPCYSEKECPVTLFHFEYLLELAKKGLPICLFSALSYKRKMKNKFKTSFFSIIDRLKNHSNVELLDTIPFNKFKNKIINYSICMPCYHSAASQISLIKGIVPVVWNEYVPGFLDREVLLELGIKDKYNELTKRQIIERIDKLLNDKNYYQYELDCMRMYASIYSKKEALYCFNKLIGD